MSTTTLCKLYYYGQFTYSTGILLYNLYGYWEFAKNGYTFCSHTYSSVNKAYNWVKSNKTKSSEISEDWIDISGIKRLNKGK